MYAETNVQNEGVLNTIELLDIKSDRYVMIRPRDFFIKYAGEEDTKDPNAMINKIAGKRLMINYKESKKLQEYYLQETGKAFNVFVSKEYPDIVLYEQYFDNISNQYILQDQKIPFATIAKVLNTSRVRAENAFKSGVAAVMTLTSSYSILGDELELF
jgi:hypothetical protein